MSFGVHESFNKMKFIKYSNGISSRDPIPFKWHLDENSENIFDYLKSIIKDQIIFDGFSKKSIEFLDLRAKIVNQIIQICKNFRLKNETLFKTVQIFDMYCWKISNFRTFKKTRPDSEKDLAETSNVDVSIDSLSDLLKELKIVIVMCLNISCKLEEINCNYISYFKENLLDEHEKNEFYDIKNLIKKETEILKIVSFKISSPSFYVFNNIYVQLLIFEYFTIKNYSDVDDMQNFITHFVRLNDIIVKVYCTLHESVYISPLYSGLICIKTTSKYFEYLYTSNLSYLDKYLMNILNSTSYDVDFDFIEHVSMRLFTLIKSKNLKL